MFKFHAQQGQTDAVCRILTTVVGKPKVVKTTKGFLITCEIPKDLSRRKIDRLLFENKIPGSHSRANKYPVFSGEKSELIYDDRVRKAGPFNWVYRGKFMGKMKVYLHVTGCSCCGNYWDMKPAKRPTRKMERKWAVNQMSPPLFYWQ
jgi:hypothetical protein